jgi:hypothetical protein
MRHAPTQRAALRLLCLQLRNLLGVRQRQPLDLLHHKPLPRPAARPGSQKPRRSTQPRPLPFRDVRGRERTLGHGCSHGSPPLRRLRPSRRSDCPMREPECDAARAGVTQGTAGLAEGRSDLLCAALLRQGFPGQGLRFRVWVLCRHLQLVEERAVCVHARSLARCSTQD